MVRAQGPSISETGQEVLNQASSGGAPPAPVGAPSGPVPWEDLLSHVLTGPGSFPVGAPSGPVPWEDLLSHVLTGPGSFPDGSLASISWSIAKISRTSLLAAGPRSARRPPGSARRGRNSAAYLGDPCVATRWHHLFLVHRLGFRREKARSTHG